MTTPAKTPTAKAPAARTTTRKSPAATAGKAAPAKAAPVKAAANGKVDFLDKDRLAAYRDKEITVSMKEYFAWIKQVTGVEVEPRSAYLGYMMRGPYQAANRAAR